MPSDTEQQISAAGLYVHVPFCSSRCVYCAFYSTTLLGERTRYVEALCREMTTRACEAEAPRRVGTVYLGGGTPSQLTAEQLQRLFSQIFSVYDVAEGAEVTMECNPDDVTADFAHLLASLPVNRVSMGAQTFSDARLRFLRRRHSSRQVREAVERLRSVGIGNISIDLIYGFPDESLEEWHADIDAALRLDVEHLSAYALSFEEGTPLFAMLQRGEVKEADDELQRQMYYGLKDRLQAAGYEHYEISNFARPGLRSRHNSAYWNHTPYVGLGAGAHSFYANKRQWNVADVSTYTGDVMSGIIKREYEILDGDTLYNDLVMTALRTKQGLRMSLLDEVKAGYCMKQARKYLDCGWLKREDGCLRLTRNGLFVSDLIIADLFVV